MNYAPIVLFVFNRLLHTQQTIESLKKNILASETNLYIYSDGSKSISQKESIEDVRAYIKTINGFKKIQIIERNENLGLSKSIISGVSEVINKYGKVIVLEDDMISSPNFLIYMNKCLDSYKSKSEIFSISGYSYPVEIPEAYKDEVYLFHRISSWGWATWKDRWDSVDWEVKDFNSFISNKNEREKFNMGGEDCTVMLLKQIQGKIDSWAIRFNYSSYKRQTYTLYPVVSKILNIGTDGSGTHFKLKTKKFDTFIDIDEENQSILSDIIKPNEEIQNIIRFYLKKSLIRKLINFIKIKTYRVY